MFPLNWFLCHGEMPRDRFMKSLYQFSGQVKSSKIFQFSRYENAVVAPLPVESERSR
jgi:hypothetical protein